MYCTNIIVFATSIDIHIVTAELLMRYPAVEFYTCLSIESISVRSGEQLNVNAYGLISRSCGTDAYIHIARTLSQFE